MTDEAVRAIYYRVIQITSAFLEQSSGLTIDALKTVDPSVEQLAKTMRTLATVLKDLAGDSWDDENMALNAFQCCLTMERLADVVATSDEDGLNQVLKDLELHAKVP